MRSGGGTKSTRLPGCPLGLPPELEANTPSLLALGLEPIITNVPLGRMGPYKVQGTYKERCRTPVPRLQKACSHAITKFGFLLGTI